MRGGTQPHLMRCSNGCYYVIKFPNNPQGKRVLVNELLGARFAERLGIPVAEADIISVDPNLIEMSAECRIELSGSRVRCAAGLCFGSRYLGDPHRVAVWDFIGDTQIRACENISDFLGMLVFDIWTSNSDLRQTLFLKDDGQTKFRTLMIDQSLCFWGAQWRLTDYDDRRHLYARSVVYDGAQGICDFEAWLCRLEDAIGEQYLQGVAAEVPVDWYGAKTVSLNRLLEQLDKRRMSVRDRITSLARISPRFFPNWRAREVSYAGCTLSRR
jgi:HipA-like kinase